MAADSSPNAWSAVLSSLEAGLDPLEGLTVILASCAQLHPDSPWEDLAGLPLDAERELLETWLLEGLDHEPPPGEVGELWLALRPNLWQGQPDGCNLELRAGPAEASPGERHLWRGADTLESPVLGHLLRVAGAAPASVGRLLREEVAVGTAALLARALFERFDAALILGGRAERSIAVGYEPGPGLILGAVGEGGWSNQDLGLYSSQAV